jgi:hypothetical protein
LQKKQYLPVLQTNGSGVLSFASSSAANTPAFFAYRDTSTQSITPATETKVQAQTELFDTNSCYDNSTNYRFTPTTAGKYFIFGNIFLDGSGYVQEARVKIFKNGSAIANSKHQFSSASFAKSVNVSSIIDLNGTTDYVELYGYMTNAGNAGFNAGQTECYFGGYKLIGV